MIMKRYGLLLALLLLFSPVAAQTLQCTYEYKIKKVEQVKTWYGTVEKPSYKTGITSGSGKTEAGCKQTISDRLTQDGWKIIRLRKQP